MNKLSERFEHKIPTFLAHLDIWNDTPVSDCKYTTHIHLYELQQTPIMLQSSVWQ